MISSCILIYYLFEEARNAIFGPKASDRILLHFPTTLFVFLKSKWNTFHSLAGNKFNANAGSRGRLSFFHPIYGHKQNIWRNALAGGRSTGKQNNTRGDERKMRLACAASVSESRNPNTRTARLRKPKKICIWFLGVCWLERGGDWSQGVCFSFHWRAASPSAVRTPTSVVSSGPRPPPPLTSARSDAKLALAERKLLRQYINFLSRLCSSSTLH